MITETHQCPSCGAILSTVEIDLQACKGCGACYLPKKISNVHFTRHSHNGLQQLGRAINRMDAHILRGFNGGFGHFLKD
jgi:predicted  nucleic acid-binding Zn-ribbon protein